jgi:hypothetical protein
MRTELVIYNYFPIIKRNSFSCVFMRLKTCDPELGLVVVLSES